VAQFTVNDFAGAAWGRKYWDDYVVKARQAAELRLPKTLEDE